MRNVENLREAMKRNNINYYIKNSWKRILFRKWSNVIRQCVVFPKNQKKSTKVI